MSPLLLAALIAVESSGNDRAIGDQGRAFGCLQIRREALQDVNRVHHTHYTRQDCFDRFTAMQICQAYLNLYAKNQSPRQQALVWHYGPTGARHHRNSDYALRVEMEMIRIRNAEPFSITFPTSIESGDQPPLIRLKR